MAFEVGCEMCIKLATTNFLILFSAPPVTKNLIEESFSWNISSNHPVVRNEEISPEFSNFFVVFFHAKSRKCEPLGRKRER